MTVYGLNADVLANQGKGVQLYIPGKTQLTKDDLFLGGTGTGVTDEMLNGTPRLAGQTADDTADLFANYQRQPQPLPQQRFRPGARVTMAMKEYLDKQAQAERDYQTNVNQWNATFDNENDQWNKKYEQDARTQAIQNAILESEVTGNYNGQPTLANTQWNKTFDYNAGQDAIANQYRNAALSRAGSGGGSKSSNDGGNGVVANTNATTISYGKQLKEALQSGADIPFLNSKIAELEQIDPRVDGDWLRTQLNSTPVDNWQYMKGY